MTPEGVPSDPSVLNTTVLSNFSSIDRVNLLAAIAGVCTVPAVREELESGVDAHPYLRPALDALDDDIPVVSPSETAANREAVVRERLDPERHRHLQLPMCTAAAC
jgi:predicted nucleic acid-binding protein